MFAGNVIDPDELWNDFKDSYYGSDVSSDVDTSLGSSAGADRHVDTSSDIVYDGSDSVSAASSYNVSNSDVGGIDTTSVNDINVEAYLFAEGGGLTHNLSQGLLYSYDLKAEDNVTVSVVDSFDSDYNGLFNNNDAYFYVEFDFYSESSGFICEPYNDASLRWQLHMSTTSGYTQYWRLFDHEGNIIGDVNYLDLSKSFKTEIYNLNSLHVVHDGAYGVTFDGRFNTLDLVIEDIDTRVSEFRIRYYFTMYDAVLYNADYYNSDGFTGIDVDNCFWRVYTAIDGVTMLYNTYETERGLFESIFVFLQSILDGILGLPQSIYESVMGLFVPTYYNPNFFEENNQRFKDLFDSSFRGLVDAYELLSSSFGLLYNTMTDSTVIDYVELPELSFNFGTDEDPAVFVFGGDVVELVPYGMESLVDVLKLIVNVVCTLAFLVMYLRKLERILGV